MTNKPRFFAEIKRRNVLRAAAFYTAVARLRAPLAQLTSPATCALPLYANTPKPTLARIKEMFTDPRTSSTSTWC